MKTIFYLDVDLYHYFIGRNDQQIRVMNEMIKSYRYDDLMKMDCGLRKYMFHCLEALMITTTLFIISKDESGRKEDLNAWWAFIKDYDLKMYRKLRLKSVLVTINYLPWQIKRIVLISGYRFLRARIKLG